MDKNETIQTNNEGWMMHTAESFTQTPFRIHKSKRKELLAGIERPRERAKAIPKPEIQSISRDNSLQQSTDCIGNTPSDISDWTHADDNKFSGISAEAMISIDLPQDYSSNQWSVESPIPIAGWIWTQFQFLKRILSPPQPAAPIATAVQRRINLIFDFRLGRNHSQ